MTDRSNTSPEDQQDLQELFVDVTGETVVTIQRDDARGRGVVDAARETSPDEVPDVDPVPDGLGDAIGQSTDESG